MEWLRVSKQWFQRQDLGALVLMLVVVAGLWGFVELADEVREGDTRSLDEQVVRALRNPADLSDPRGPVWFEEGVRDITALGGFTVLLLLSATVLGFVLLQRQYHAFGLVLAALVGGIVLNLALKNIFDRPRPDIVPALHHVSTHSFPSGHSLLSTVVYLTLGALLTRLVKRRRLKLYILGVAAFTALLVGLSRIYLGVHYPTDVLAGWTIGLVWSVLCWLVADYLQRRGMVERPGETSEGTPVETST